MKIETSIAPRRNGELGVVTPAGTKVLFVNANGRLVADLTDEKDLAFLLSKSDFYPADEADYTQAASLIRAPAENDIAGEGDDLLDDEGDENAAPVETATAPKPGKYTKKSK